MPRKYQPKPEIDPATVMQTPTTDGRIAFWVASRSGKNICYLVEQRGASLFCSCPARKPCCHIRAVAARIALDAEAAKVAARAELASVFAEHCFDECLDLAAAHEEALAASQAKADALVQLPRELAQVSESEESKMERMPARREIQLTPDQQALGAQIHKATLAEMRRSHKPRLERERLAAKREAALLYTDDKPFSIYRS